MNNNIKLTIGIKALNEEANIERAIVSSLQAINDINGEVVLADSGSSDRTVAIAGAFDIRIVTFCDTAERSCGAAAQLAFEHATGEFFLLIDGDMELDPSFVGKALSLLETNPDLAGVGGYIAEKNLLSEEYRIRSQSLSSAREPAKIVDRLDGGGLYRTAAVRQAGYFSDRNLHAYEEYELGARLRFMGWKLLRVSDLAANHFGHTVSGQSLIFKRLKSGYATGLGQLVRSALFKPHWRYTLEVVQLRQSLVVIGWWITLLLLGVLYPLALIPLFILPLLFLMSRRRSIGLGFYSMISWNVNALGLVIGIFRRRKSPYSPISAKLVK